MTAPRRWRNALFIAAIIAAAAVAYANSWFAPFVFDDYGSILENPTIRHLGHWGTILSPPFAAGQTVGGRPVLNATLALNYAISGTAVWSYHVVNWLIHVLAGLTLFGLARRTLLRWRPLGEEKAGWLAFAIALVWTVHPLQTESVTYVVQRAESLMGLFYLLTLYCFVRSADPTSSGGSGRGTPPGISGPDRFDARNAKRRSAPHSFDPSGEPPLLFSVPWCWLSILCCLLGMGTKEVMVSAPCMVFLYDRAFVSGDGRTAVKRHWPLYAGLAGTWIPLMFWVVSTHGRGGTAGGQVPVPWSDYVLTQFPALCHYLRLAIWPHPLIFYYEARWVSLSAVIAPAAVIGTLLILTLWGLWRNTAAAFLGAMFFAVLAPTSLVPGIAQTIAEHRMYLALAPVLAVYVLLLNGVGGARPPGALGPTAPRSEPPLKSRSGQASLRSAWTGWQRIWLFLLVVPAGALIALTVRRNYFYRSAIALWEDTVAKRPLNPFARNNLGEALVRAGRPDEAIEQFETSLRLNGGQAAPNNNLANVLKDQGRIPEAVQFYRAALAIDPRYAEASNGLGVALTAEGKNGEAMRALQTAVRLSPDYAEARYNLGVVHSNLGDLPAALADYQAALALRPDFPEAGLNLGNTLARLGRPEDAMAQYDAVLKLHPDYAEAHYDKGNTWALQRRWREAAAEYRETLRLKPDHALARDHLQRVAALLAIGEGSP